MVLSYLGDYDNDDYFIFHFIFLVDIVVQTFFQLLNDNQEKTLVCLRLLRKALFLVRTLKPKVLALLNQANSPAAACGRDFGLKSAPL